MRLPLLSTRTVAAVMSAPRLTLAANTPITEALERLRALGLPGLPIVDETDRYRGSLGVATLTEAEKSGAEGPIGQLLDGPAPTLTPDATLDAAVQALATGTHTWLPVVDQGRVMGIVGMSEVITGYRDALRANLNVLVRPSSTVLVEQRLSNHAPVTGRTIAEIIWPAGTLILAIQRKDELIFPDGATSLESGDLVSALANANSADKLEAMLTAPPADEGDGDGDQRMQLI
jgi:CBS domain-containing protein